MKNENLTELITNHWFDQFQSGLGTRFSANRMDYKYRYEKTDSNNSVVVDLKKNGIDTRIELTDKGILSFDYSLENRNHSERFKNCTEDDFHTMLAHAFIYLRDGTFDYHKDWFEKLQRI
ncbi:MAG: hypothetical protein KDC52_05310 [Ignavibacteriae bacterium]|nr:hypothetical protein [Ignavibacteriota bacterium]MCB0750872.1 hypothetical protein [Ignavibacteriota bacterium]